MICCLFNICRNVAYNTFIDFFLVSHAILLSVVNLGGLGTNYCGLSWQTGIEGAGSSWFVYINQKYLLGVKSTHVVVYVAISVLLVHCSFGNCAWLYVLRA